MRIRKTWRSIDFRKIYTIFYCLMLAVYLIIGLQPAEAKDYEAATEISIPAIGLESDVVTLNMIDNRLDTPDTIVGRFTWAKHKTLLVGHRSTVFPRLNELTLNDLIYYDGDIYKITDMVVKEKSEISMRQVLAEAERETIMIMTCAGEDLGGGDATHRLIVTAVLNE